MAFCGRDETNNSHNQENFLELLTFLANHNESINNVVLDNASRNSKVIAHDIKKYLVCSAAIEITNTIMENLGDVLFFILFNESRDVSIKEQAAIALHYVDFKGRVVERFFGIVHVSNTTALSLKAAIEALFSKHNLSLSRIRGQGYDGASNMQG